MRQLPSWVQGFKDFTEKSGSPAIFRQWTAIFTVAAALERKVWFRTNIAPLYPNLYVILVGPAGVGKTNATSAAYEFIARMDDPHIAPTNISRAALIDSLEESNRKVPTPDLKEVLDYHSLAIYSNELGTFIPSYENDLINVLTDLYDCKRFVEKKRVLKKEIHMRDTQLNLLAATTPSYLNSLLPEGAWDQGFISRTMLIYSGLVELVDPFFEIDVDRPLFDALVADLRAITSMVGPYAWTDEAVAAFREWRRHNQEPTPTHPKLQNYVSRRHSHLFKLCMVSAASRSSTLRIELDNYREALGWLLEAERAMPDIFKAMVTGGATKVINDTWYFAYEWYIARQGKTPIPESLIWEFVSARAPVGDVPRILDSMKRTGILEETLLAGVGTAYKVRPRA